MPNKSAIITGAANGLGRALSIALYNSGYGLALIDIDEEGLTRLKDEIQRDGQTISVHTLDISDESKVIKCRQAILAIHTRIDVLINNAGISISQPFGEVEMEDFQRLFQVNFWGTVYCTKHFLPDLKKKAGSHIVNIISVFAAMGFPGKSTYGASKSAVMGFTNSLRTELIGTSVSLSLVIPPALDTGIIARGKHINEVMRQKEIEFLQQNAMPVDRVAAIIVTKMHRNKYRIVIGRQTFWMDTAARLFPGLMTWLIAKRKKRIEFV